MSATGAATVTTTPLFTVTGYPAMMLMRLPVSVARIVILPPGPAAAGSSKERSCPVLLTLMATPVELLCRLMLPPDRLCRRGTPVAGSLEETVIGEFTEIVPPVEFRFTVPPAPFGSEADGWRPVVAEMGELTVIAPVAFTVNVPPSPGARVSGVAPPLNVTGPWMLSAAESPKVSDGTLRVSWPPANGPN